MVDCRQRDPRRSWPLPLPCLEPLPPPSTHTHTQARTQAAAPGPLQQQTGSTYHIDDTHTHQPASSARPLARSLPPAAAAAARCTMPPDPSAASSTGAGASSSSKGGASYRERVFWTPEEDALLLKLVAIHGPSPLLAHTHTAPSHPRGRLAPCSRQPPCAAAAAAARPSACGRAGRGGELRPPSQLSQTKGALPTVRTLPSSSPRSRQTAGGWDGSTIVESLAGREPRPRRAVAAGGVGSSCRAELPFPPSMRGSLGIGGRRLIPIVQPLTPSLLLRPACAHPPIGLLPARAHLPGSKRGKDSKYVAANRLARVELRRGPGRRSPLLRAGERALPISPLPPSQRPSSPTDPAAD